MNRLLLLGMLLCTTLTACGKSRPELAQTALLPMPASTAPVDPDNDQLMHAITAYVAQNGAPANSQFEYTRIDLNNDTRREGLVMMKSPHQFWCGIYGCRMLVFQAHDEGFSFLNEIAPVRGPITVTEERTNGWRNMNLIVDGRTGWDRKQVALQFNGLAYPAQPAFLPATYASTMLAGDGVRIFP